MWACADLVWLAQRRSDGVFSPRCATPRLRNPGVAVNTVLMYDIKDQTWTPQDIPFGYLQGPRYGMAGALVLSVLAAVSYCLRQPCWCASTAVWSVPFVNGMSQVGSTWFLIGGLDTKGNLQSKIESIDLSLPAPSTVPSPQSLIQAAAYPAATVSGCLVRHCI
jgi:hypothetical protein